MRLRDRFVGAGGLGAGRHVVDCEGAALAVGCVGRGAVQGLAVVQGDAAGGQVGDDGLAVVDQFAHIEQDIAALGLVVNHGAQVRAGDELHGAVVQVYVVEREPAADQIGGQAFPVGVVLVPEYGAAVVGRLVDGLVVEELDVGAENVFDDVEKAFVVGELVEADVVLGDLHELEQLLLVVAVVVVVFAGDGQVADGTFAAAGEGEFGVVFGAHLVDEVIFEHFADDQETVFPEAGDLLLAEGFVAVSSFNCFGGLHLGILL